MKDKTRNWNRKTLFLFQFFCSFSLLMSREKINVKSSEASNMQTAKFFNKMVCRQFIVNVYKNMACGD
ncbi:hypothetical protein FJU10_15440 [Enterococcus sp. OL5]|nr:hypothetical protein FJU10_15440 [Enterococcus sp. OL5]